MQTNRVKFKTKEEESRFYRQSREHSQTLYSQSPEEIANELNRRCPWCQELLLPTIHKFTFCGKSRLQAVFPDRCGCKGEHTGLMAEEARRALALEEFGLRHWAETLNNAGLVGWLASATFESYQVREDWRFAVQCKAAVQDYCRDLLSGKLKDKPWLILHGTVGTGKSHLAAAVIRECLTFEFGHCYFRVWPDYLRRMLNSFDRQPDEERTGDIVGELQRGRVVVIDDIDKRQPSKSGWTEDELYTVLNHRYNERAPTILTFNHAPGKIEKYLGKPILDRAVGAAYDVVNFDGPSYRWRD